LEHWNIGTKDTIIKKQETNKSQYSIIKYSNK